MINLLILEEIKAVQLSCQANMANPQDVKLWAFRFGFGRTVTWIDGHPELYDMMLLHTDWDHVSIPSAIDCYICGYEFHFAEALSEYSTVLNTGVCALCQTIY